MPSPERGAERRFAVGRPPESKDSGRRTRAVRWPGLLRCVECGQRPPVAPDPSGEPAPEPLIEPEPVLGWRLVPLDDERCRSRQSSRACPVSPVQAEKSGEDAPMPVPAPLVEVSMSEPPEAPVPPTLEPVPGVLDVAGALLPGFASGPVVLPIGEPGSLDMPPAVEPVPVALPVPPMLVSPVLEPLPLMVGEVSLPAPALELLEGSSSRLRASRDTHSPYSLPVKCLHAAAGVEPDAPGEPDMLSLVDELLVSCAKTACAPANAEMANAAATAREIFPICLAPWSIVKKGRTAARGTCFQPIDS